MTQTSKRVVIGTIICVCCIGFLGLIAYQNSEALSTLRVQSLLRSFHNVLANDLENSTTNRSTLLNELNDHPISSAPNVLTIILGSEGDIIAGNWDSESANPPEVVNAVLNADFDSPEPLSSLMLDGVLVNWVQGDIGNTPYKLVLVSIDSDLAWAEALRVFIVPILIALAIGVWGVGWLVLMFRGIFASEVAARQSAEEARLEAEQANLAKSEFLSMMSHELRTPLNGIIGFTEILLLDRGTTLSDEHAVAVDQVLKAGEQLLGLINQVLDLSTIEAGGSPLEIEDVNAAEVVDECVKMLEKTATSKELRIISPESTLGKTPIVKTDRTRFKQVLLNLLGNAIKYNTTGKVVSVEWQMSQENRLRLSVTDDGPGIPLEHQDKVFVPFNRLGMAGREIEGTGIGLSISKQIVEQMGGKIGFKSIPGKSTTFWFDIELSKMESIPRKIESITSIICDEKKIENQNVPLKQILYIEDNPSNTLLMQRIITRLEGYELLSAITAEAGISMAQTNKPCMILMDINLPGMNGIEALRELQTNELTKLIPVVAVSAVAMEAGIELGKEAGFTRYLTKPLSVATTLNTLREVLASGVEVQESKDS